MLSRTHRKQNNKKRETRKREAKKHTQHETNHATVYEETVIGMGMNPMTEFEIAKGTAEHLIATGNEMRELMRMVSYIF